MDPWDVDLENCPKREQRLAKHIVLLLIKIKDSPIKQCKMCKVQQVEIECMQKISEIQVRSVDFIVSMLISWIW